MSEYVKQLCDVCDGTGNQASPHDALVCLSCSGMRYIYVNPPLVVHLAPPEYPDEPPSRPA